MKTANFPIIEFRNISNLNPQWSSWSCFCDVIRGRKNLSRKTIKSYFETLVDKDDYAQNERFQLLNYLYSLAANSEECR
jgi:hypothetical protein